MGVIANCLGSHLVALTGQQLLLQVVPSNSPCASGSLHAVGRRRSSRVHSGLGNFEKSMFGEVSWVLSAVARSRVVSQAVPMH